MATSKVSAPIPGSLDKDQLRKAVHALLKHVNGKKNETKDLLEDDYKTIWLSLTLKKIPLKVSDKPARIPVPHPIRDSTTEVCLFVKDPQREYKDKVAEQGIDCIKKVIGLTKLRKKYTPFEVKRQLCNSYSLFLADERILPMLAKNLGKAFFTRNKQPSPICVTRKNLKGEVMAALSATYLLVPKGPCCTVRIGLSSQNEDQIVENILAGLPYIVGRIPGRWKNIQTLHIRCEGTVALPFYSSLPHEAKEALHQEKEKESQEPSGVVASEKPEKVTPKAAVKSKSQPALKKTALAKKKEKKQTATVKKSKIATVKVIEKQTAQVKTAKVAKKKAPAQKKASPQKNPVAKSKTTKSTKSTKSKVTRPKM